MKKLKIKKHVYDYCGNCFKIVKLTKFPAWNPTSGTLMVDDWECPKCGENSFVQPVEGLLEIIKIVREDKREWKRLEKENNKYWRSKKNAR